VNRYGNLTKPVAMSSFNALPSWVQQDQSSVEDIIKRSGLEKGAKSKRRHGEREQTFTDAVVERSSFVPKSFMEDIVKRSGPENGPGYKRRRDERGQTHEDTVNEDQQLVVENIEQLADGSVITRNVGGWRNCHLVYKNLRSVFPDDAVDDMIVFAREQKRSKNPMNAKTFLNRKQFAFTRGGATYNFGQDNPVVGHIENLGPRDRCRLVWMCVDQAARAVHSGQVPGLPGRRSLEEIKQAVVCAQVNLYPGGSQLGYHQDDERHHSAGSPIVGFTFYNSGFRDGTATRHFVVSNDKAGKHPVSKVATKHGDMIIMCGNDFQKKLWHSIPKVTSKALEGMLRLSVTVRFNFDESPSQSAESTDIVEDSSNNPIEVLDSDDEDSDSDSDMVPFSS
jgi:hypothetical protein